MYHRVKKIYELESLTGFLIFIASAFSLAIANSAGSPANWQIFENFFNIKFALNFSWFGIYKNLSLLDWINDFLMSLFFLLVGLELKEEIHDGELSTLNRAILPLFCAIGGALMPIMIFCFFNFNHPENLRGFAIGSATDIAFAYGVICIFGKRINKSLKIFLISLAIFDDLLAIIFIAIFYTQNLDFLYLFYGFLTIVFLLILNIKKVTALYFYLIAGFILWVFILKSGIHPSIAGVILALTIPNAKNTIAKLIKNIAPMVNFLILPIFAFANCAIDLNYFSSEILIAPLFLGIFLALFLGKQFGVMIVAFFLVYFKITRLPRTLFGSSVNWWQFYGVSVLTGIGFTMSFFIGNLAFHDQIKIQQIKIAVGIASISSAILGMIVIYLTIFFSRKKTNF